MQAIDRKIAAAPRRAGSLIVILRLAATPTGGEGFFIIDYQQVFCGFCHASARAAVPVLPPQWDTLHHIGALALLVTASGLAVSW